MIGRVACVPVIEIYIALLLRGIVSLRFALLGFGKQGAETGRAEKIADDGAAIVGEAVPDLIDCGLAGKRPGGRRLDKASD